MEKPRRKKPLRFLKLFLLAVVLFFVGKTLVNGLENITWSAVEVNPWFIALCLFFELTARFFIGVLYGLLLGYLKAPLKLGVAAAVSWLSFLGKYVPGKVAVVASAVYLLSSFNIRPAVAAVAPVMANVMTVAVSLLLAIPLLFSSMAGNLAVFAHLIVILFVLASLVALKPRYFIKPCNFMLKKLRYPPIEVDFTVKQALMGIIVVVGQCLSVGLSTWSLVSSFVPLGLHILPLMVSISALAGTMGLLALFSPAGIGVREGIYFLFFSPLIGPDVAALVVICLRLLQTAMDLFTAGLGAIWLHFERKPRK